MLEEEEQIVAAFFMEKKEKRKELHVCIFFYITIYTHAFQIDRQTQTSLSFAFHVVIISANDCN
jgi:hypothetical protein